ncbi:type IV pilus modification PilV family protein [Marinobacterium arenosum]|uniref:type IV pilus modification PilV family protein n=1 Tax=Marinobacterium arenosum TaxID=2862496 RepID=UPI001C95F6DC|nr:hypothetical protein [Marinobacterium arenosum]MBY4678238.1 hypothetical protein [Marinobacterium arenosum]
MIRTHSGQRGVGFIEVLVSLFVLGFGLLSLSMFSGGLFSESAQVKAETEAMQLAQQKLELVRELAARNGLATVSGGTENNLTGVNAVYTRVATISFVPNSTAPRHANVQVAVNWTDADGNQSVSLRSFISASDTEAMAGLVGDGLDGGGFVDTPVGGAQYADGTFTPDGDTQELSDDYGVPGSKIYLDTPNYILTDADNEKLLISQTQFSTITGRVYIKSGAVDQSVVIVKPSDVGVCPKRIQLDGSGDPVRDGEGAVVTEVREVRLVDGDNVDVLEGDTTDGTLLYSYYTYDCFFGSGWYGNIGILRTDSTNSNDRICGGDPDLSDSGNADSRHPQLLGARGYRGYTPQFDITDIDNDGDLTEPAIDGSGNRIYLSDGMAEGDAYGDTSRSSVDQPQTHDFLITVISGSPVDADCLAELVVSSSDEFQNNSGSFVCLYDENGNKTCPDELPEDLGFQVTTTPRQISGTISVAEGESASSDQLSLVTSQAESCTIDEADLSWNCTVYDAGGGWTGTITLSSSNLNICSVATYAFGDLTADVSGYEYSLASSCVPGDTEYNVTGVVRNLDNNNSVDLSASAVVSSGEGSCAASLGVIDDARSGSNEVAFTCTVPAGFNGSITLDSLPSRTRIVSHPDFSGSPVSGNVSGAVIEVR